MKLPLALIASGLIGGLLLLNGGKGGAKPSPEFNDSLAESHKADRSTQVRILREYVGKTFASELDARDWLNNQRIEARKNDFAPYTDELGNAADAGVEEVKALADKLEGKQ